MGINSYSTPGTSPIERLASLAGVVKAGKETYDAFKDSSRKSDELAQMADPNSPLSQEVRRQATTAGVQVPETLTAKTAKDTGLLDFVQKSALEKQKQAGDHKLEIAKLRLQVGQDKMKPLAAEQADKLSGHDSALKTLDDLEATINGNPDAFGPVMGRLNQLNPYDTKSKGVKALLDQAAQTIGKALEGGKMTDQDRLFYQNMLPTNANTPEIALNKVGLLRRMIEQKRQADLGTFSKAGLNVKNFAPNTTSDLVTTQAGAAGPKGGMIPDASANDQSNNVRVMNGATYVKVKGGWKRM
jgi:hypothetical protein